MSTEPNRYSREEVCEIHDLPLPELLYRAQTVHRKHHDPGTVQLCSLLSIKTGGCPEDCAYCPQSARHEKSMTAEKLMKVDDVLLQAGNTPCLTLECIADTLSHAGEDLPVYVMRGEKKLELQLHFTTLTFTQIPSKRGPAKGIRKEAVKQRVHEETEGGGR